MSCMSNFSSFSGSKKTVGEFFNPGLNCSDISDKRDDAKDGFYWITLKGPNPVKVAVSSHKRLFNVLFISHSSIAFPKRFPITWVYFYT